VRQADVEADRLAAGVVRAAIGGFHDPGPPPEVTTKRVLRADGERPLREHARQLARFLVVARPLDRAAALARRSRRRRGCADAVHLHQLVERVLRRLAAVNARRPEEHDGVLDVLELEATLRLEVFGEDADGACIFALQKGVIEVSLRLRTHPPIIHRS
jgi:hypothetical protein